MTIRLLHERDHDAWLRMRQALWPDCDAAMHRYEMAEYATASEPRAVFVLDPGDGPLGGFIELSVRPRVDGSMSKRVGFVEGWYVEPDLRGHGWGARLMEQAEAWTRAQGLTELASDTEWDNEAGLLAHKALGFHETFRLVHLLKSV